MASNNGSNPPNHPQRNDPRLVMSRAPRAVPLSSHYLQQPMASSSVGGLPPVPIRRAPTMASSYGRMGMGMGGYYSPYSRYPTNMYTPGYGGYGMSRMPSYGHYGTGDAAPFNSFIQMAEESTRPAFESIESVVEVVGSISMMLESTYHAVHSSYSAILGVVDQFSRLRDHLAQMLSVLALLRALRWLCLKVLYVLRLRKDNPSDETVWSSAEVLSGNLPPRPSKGGQGSAWPFLMFIGLVIGAPWLMFKLLSKSVTKKPLDLRMFHDEQGRKHVATAGYDFKATQRDELSFSAGERLYLAPASYKTGPNGWIYACNSKQETGLVPQNYLVSAATAKPSAPKAKIVPQVTTLQQPTFDELQAWAPVGQSNDSMNANAGNSDGIGQTNGEAEIDPEVPKDDEPASSKSGDEC